jgi:hypothetical protein
MAYLKPELFVIASAPAAIASGDTGGQDGGQEKGESHVDNIPLQTKTTVSAYEADE